MSITCPAGWTSSPASLAWEPRCYLVPPERSISLFQCVNLCKEHGGAPACIGSVEENDFVTAELVANDLWLGLYQNETGLGPAKGWGRCVTGDAPSFSNWYEGQPNDYAGFKQDCSWIDARSGQWHGLACDGGVHLDPLPWRLAELSCLCVHGNASAAFAIGVKALEATRGYNQRLLSTRTAIAFAAAIAIAMFPTLLLLGRAGWRRLRRHRVSCVGVDPPSQLTTVGSDSSIARRQRGISSGFRIRLRAARKSAAGRRLRVSFGMGQAGWALLVIGGMPADMLATGQSITAAVGSSRWWLVLNSLGYCLLLLALFPTDARAIRVVCVTALVVWSSLGLLFITATLSGNRPDEFGFPAAALFFISAALVLRARVIFLGRDCCDRRAMQPRPALRWLWTALRVLNLGYGVLNARVGIADYARGGDHYDHKATAALSATCLLIAALASPRNRGRLHRRLGRLGKRGSEAEEAAAVAALVGGHDSDAALERASKLLRCLPAGRLHATDLADSTTAPLAGPTLYERTEPAAMGEVTAFLSHSWSDEKEAPGAKHAVVSCWAKQRQDTTGAEPTLWLVRRSPNWIFIPHMHAP